MKPNYQQLSIDCCVSQFIHYQGLRHSITLICSAIGMFFRLHDSKVLCEKRDSFKVVLSLAFSLFPFLNHFLHLLYRILIVSGSVVSVGDNINSFCVEELFVHSVWENPNVLVELGGNVS